MEGWVVDKVQAKGYTWMPRPAFYAHCKAVAPARNMGLLVRIHNAKELDATMAQVWDYVDKFCKRESVRFSTFSVMMAGEPTYYSIKFCV